MATEIKRILLVEDSPQDVELVLDALEEHRLANEVVVVENGEQALDFAFRRGNFRMRYDGHPAVILLDVKLPKVDGMEVLAQLKGSEELRHIPVVMLTSSREEKDLLRSYELGANAYVVKPVDFNQFSDAIRELGLFWAVINHPPPGCIPPGQR
jgi:CheY-like chemotaxis protein